MTTRPVVSFEYFPPKTAAQEAALGEAAVRLARLSPAFVSVTYGAGGSSQPRSLATVEKMLAVGIPVAAHLTCAGASTASLDATIRWLRAKGVARFVALRGDPPGGLAEPYAPHPDGYRDTAHLVAALKRAGASDVAVSAYPERHPQSADWETEIAVLRRKVDAGADRAVTQFFFDNAVFDAYRERVLRAGIAVPIVPGIIPIHRFGAVRDFAARCGASIPAWLAARFEGIDPDSAAHAETAVAVAAEQIADLRTRGAAEFHLYTLNRAELTEAVCVAAGLAGRNAGERTNAAAAAA